MSDHRDMFVGDGSQEVRTYTKFENDSSQKTTSKYHIPSIIIALTIHLIVFIFNYIHTSEQQLATLLCYCRSLSITISNSNDGIFDTTRADPNGR